MYISLFQQTFAWKQRLWNIESASWLQLPIFPEINSKSRVMLQDPTPLALDDLTRNKLSQAEFIISWPHVQLVENEIKHKTRKRL